MAEGGSTGTIISFNFANWVTVLIMVGFGFTLLGFIVRLVQQKKSGGATS